MSDYYPIGADASNIDLDYNGSNVGGGAEYNIVDGNYVDNGGSYHKLENDLFAELINVNEEKFINTKFLNLAIEESVANGIDNFNKIKIILKMY